ncbi:MAG: hypothetical protein KGN02_04630 [bacterium]|nr:hypothetical protein [bacterium]
MSALAAALWLAGLWYAAPLLRTTTYGRADRLRDAIVVGVAIPFALGIAHLLYPAALWIALALCVAGGIARARRFSANASPEPMPYLLVATLALVVWPAAIRPLLEGDSLLYHLPNAAMWVHAHSLWASATLYWWYPPASELFASALFAIGGPSVLPAAGALALALLGLRIEAYVRARVPETPFLADACAAAVIAIPALALQGGTLDNDVWLAAMLLDVLATPSVGAAAVGALVKPFGWIFTGLALALSRAPRASWLAAGAALAVWFAHDAILAPHAAIAIGATAIAHPWSTGIAEHGFAGLAELARVLVTRSPFAALAFICALAAPFLDRRNRALAVMAALAALWYLVMPFGYANSVPQLADGTSLRFAAAAFALGAIVLASVAGRARGAIVAIFVLAALSGAATVVATFWNDAPTRTCLVVALLALGCCALAARLRAANFVALASFVALAIASLWAVRAPAPYFADAFALDGTRSDLFVFLAARRPPRVVTWGLRGGVVTVLSPASRTFDTPPGADGCARARAMDALLVVFAQRNDPAPNAPRRAVAERCGRVLYQDPLAVVAQP